MNISKAFLNEPTLPITCLSVYVVVFILSCPLPPSTELLDFRTELLTLLVEFRDCARGWVRPRGRCLDTSIEGLNEGRDEPVNILCAVELRDILRSSEVLLSHLSQGWYVRLGPKTLSLWLCGLPAPFDGQPNREVVRVAIEVFVDLAMGYTGCYVFGSKC